MLLFYYILCKLVFIMINMPQLFISHYQDYDTFDISNLFYNVTDLDEKHIVDLFGDDNFDCPLDNVFDFNFNNFQF